jgi:menaquinone-specific isochorismate synthase
MIYNELQNINLTLSRLKHFTYPWKVGDPLALLESLQGQPRWAWVDSDEILIAWGKMAEIQGENLDTQLGELQQDFSESKMRLFGGLPFDEKGGTDPIWDGFSTPKFVLPQYIYRQTAYKGELTVISTDQAIPQIPLPTIYRGYPVSLPAAKIKPMLGYPEWEVMVEAARHEASENHIQKVVFARTLKVIFDHQPSLVSAFAHLVDRYPGTYRFYFEPSPGHVFLGATPELLLQVKGNKLETVALAGSAPRGKTTDEDKDFGLGLLADPKNRREQEIVVDRICNDLRPLTSSFRFPKEPRLRQLPNIQHLETPIRACLKHPGIFSPARVLHPTPALAGQPRQAAMQMIRQYEPVSRGAYGAPVGWVTPQGDGRLAVAIRSGIFRGRVGRLYAGAGLLAESNPRKEWEETALKFHPMLEALISSTEANNGE